VDPVPSYPVIDKTPAEAKTLTFDFAPELAPGTTLVGPPVVTVEDGQGPEAGTGEIVPAGTAVSVQVTGGQMGAWGLVSVVCPASDGQVHEIAAVVELAPVN
jgi:hypothetical protein